MRITAKIATAGVAGLSRFPVANYTIDECTAPDGRLDAAHKREVDMLAQLVEDLRSQRDMWFEELQTVLKKE